MPWTPPAFLTTIPFETMGWCKSQQRLLLSCIHQVFWSYWHRTSTALKRTSSRYHDAWNKTSLYKLRKYRVPSEKISSFNSKEHDMWRFSDLVRRQVKNLLFYKPVQGSLKSHMNVVETRTHCTSTVLIINTELQQAGESTGSFQSINKSQLKMANA